MKRIINKAGAWLSTLPVLLLPVAASAQLSGALTNLDSVAEGIGGDSSVELPELIGNITAVLLSVLGIIFVVLVVYAGFLYLTAAGDDENVKKAKKLLGQGVVGLVIIIAAYAITDFVIGSLVDVSSTS